MKETVENPVTPKEWRQSQSVPDWLKRLLENSWELELLISGGAIFTLFQASDFFIDYMHAVHAEVSFAGWVPILVLGVFAIKILTLGFSGHLFMRALWLALICVNAAFPGGMKVSRIRWKKPFKVNLKENEDLFEAITRVDRISGSVIFFAIVSASSIIGLTFLFWITILLPSYLSYQTPAGFATYLLEAFTYINWTFFLLYIADVLIFGRLRRIPLFTYLIYFPFRFYDFVSFRFLFQKALWFFASNINPVKVFLAAFCFFILALGVTYNSVFRYAGWPNIFDQREFRWQMAPDANRMSFRWYIDEIEKAEGRFDQPAIQSSIVTGNYLKIFVPYRIPADDLVRQLPEEDRLLSNVMAVEIDDSLYEDIEWFNYWPKNLDQMGILAHINIAHLSNSRHIVRIYSPFGDEEGGRGSIIPFWKDSPPE